MTIMDTPGVKTPNDTSRIWRYMGFTKFVSLLLTKAIYFPRIDQFEDRLEGVLPELVRGQFGQSMNIWFEGNKKRLFVSCWHLNTIESVLMWKAYSSGEPLVAIESTVGALRRILQDLPDAYVIGQVNYIDLDSSTYTDTRDGNVNIVVQAYHKRAYFASESEFRIVIHPLSNLVLTAANNGRKGLRIDVSLGSLIDQIHLPAGAAPWYCDVVTDVGKHFGLDKNVVPSDI